jgi:hypothetical protein
VSECVLSIAIRSFRILISNSVSLIFFLLPSAVCCYLSSVSCSHPLFDSCLPTTRSLTRSLLYSLTLSCCLALVHRLLSLTHTLTHSLVLAISLMHAPFPVSFYKDSFYEVSRPAPNDFRELSEYFVKCEVPLAMARMRNQQKATPFGRIQLVRGGERMTKRMGE